MRTPKDSENKFALIDLRSKCLPNLFWRTCCERFFSVRLKASINSSRVRWNLYKSGKNVFNARPIVWKLSDGWLVKFQIYWNETSTGKNCRRNRSTFVFRTVKVIRGKKSCTIISLLTLIYPPGLLHRTDVKKARQKKHSLINVVDLSFGERNASRWNCWKVSVICDFGKLMNNNLQSSGIKNFSVLGHADCNVLTLKQCDLARVGIALVFTAALIWELIDKLRGEQRRSFASCHEYWWV